VRSLRPMTDTRKTKITLTIDGGPGSEKPYVDALTDAIGDATADIRVDYLDEATS